MEKHDEEYPGFDDGSRIALVCGIIVLLFTVVIAAKFHFPLQ